MSTSASAPPRIEPHVWRIAIVVILGAIMSVLDTTIINVALQTLSKDLMSPLSTIQWVATGYLLSLAAVIPLTGWAANRFGARQIYIGALVLFTLGSALCGLAASAGELIAFRVLQGVGGGMIAPVGQMILVRAAGPKNLARVMGAIGVPIVLAPVFGPTVGGVLVEHVGWQWIFLVNVPIGIVAVAASLRMLPRDEPGEARRLDAIGLGLVAVGLVGVTYGLAESGTAGSLLAPQVIGPFLVGLALIVAFILRALRIENPLLNVRLYANRAFASASLTTFSLGAALFGVMIIIPLYFQVVRGEDAVTTGLLLAPQGVGAAFAMGLSGRVTERFGAGRTAVVGVTLTGLMTVPFALLTAGTSYWLICGAMVFRGLGIGLAMMPAMTAAFAVLRPDQINDAAPQLNTLQRVGGSLGVALLTVTLQGHINDLGRVPTPGALAGAFDDTYWLAVGITVLALVPAVLLARVEERAKRRGRMRDEARASEAALEAVA